MARSDSSFSTNPMANRSNWLYYFMRALVLLIVRIIYGIRVTGQENIPREGGVLVVSNHITSLDPPVIGITFPRVMSFMAKKELFKNPLFGWFIYQLKAFPVDRSGNASSAVKESIRRLRKGDALVVFAQGTRNDGEAKAFDGAAFIAQRAKVPMVPAAIWREGRKFRVDYGRPVMAEGSSREETSALTEKIMNEVNLLLPIEHRPELS